jgi:hypothetical protein
MSGKTSCGTLWVGAAAVSGSLGSLGSFAAGEGEGEVVGALERERSQAELAATSVSANRSGVGVGCIVSSGRSGTE